MVHRREIDGQVLAFGNQGDLYLNAMTWFDHTTGSVWSQPFGEAILGPLAGSTLELLPSTLTTWAAWRDSHPDTLALDAFSRRSGFGLDLMTIVVEIGDEQVAYPVELLREHGVVTDVVFGLEIAVVIDPRDEQRWSVFSRNLGDTIAELDVIDGELADTLTETTCDPIRGLGTDGPLADRALGLLPGFTALSGSSSTPDGRVWDGS